MITAGIKDFKNKLSRYLSFVKKGEDVKISLRKALHPLIMKGLIVFPSQELNKDIPDPMEVPGKPISEMAIEDRR